MTGIHSALTASIPDLRPEVSFLPQPLLTIHLSQEREEEGGSEDIVTEVDNVLGKLMASLQKGNRLRQCLNSFPPDKTSSLNIREATLNLSA